MGKKRKTREQKIRAKLRRLEKKLQENTKKEEFKTKVKREKEKVTSGRFEARKEEIGCPDASKYLLLDLRKTLILTLLAISLELVVYWWLNIK